MKLSASISIQYDSPFSPFPASHIDEAFAWAAGCGFDGVELIASDPVLLDAALLREKLQAYGLSVSTIATGQAAGLDGLSMTSPSRPIREATRRRLYEDIDFAAAVGSIGVTIGSLRGVGGIRPEAEELDLLAGELAYVARYAAERGVVVNLEAINRYETRLLNKTHAVYDFLSALDCVDNIGILYDTFHAAIEDADMPGSVARCGRLITHVHLADSNRRLPGEGHTDFDAIARALRGVNYQGYVSLETLPIPSPGHIIGHAARSVERFKAD